MRGPRQGRPRPALSPRSSSLPLTALTALALTALAASALCGCSKSKESPPPVEDAAARALREPSAAEVQAELGKLLVTWAAAQGRGDAPAYLGLYEPGTFVGTKRLRDGGEKTYDYVAWKADREKLLKGRPKVVADAPIFETWHDGKLPTSTARATFVQRWKSGAYEDHGKKVLTLFRADDGHYKITREEMLTSSAGFDDAVDGGLVAKERDLSAWKSPIVATLAYEALATKAPLAPDMLPPRHLVLTLRDAAGKSELFELFREDVTDRPVTLGPLRPKAQKGVLFEEGFWWAGFGDYFRVVLDAERVVVKYKVVGETGPDDPPPPPALFEDQVRITLPKGAAVSAR